MKTGKEVKNIMNYPNRVSKIKSKREGYKLFFLALPLVIIVILFSFVPLFGWAFGFYNYKPGFALENLDFVGFKNFAKMVADWRDLSRVLRNTLVMSLLGIASSPIPMLFAILLNEIRRPFFKKFIQTTTTLPYFISWIIVFSLSFAIFSNEGLIANILRTMGSSYPYQSILANKKWAWVFQWVLGIWKSIGWNGIIYIAAIAGIDAELNEAARVDGANRLQLIRHITIPSLIPTYFVLLLLSISNMLSNGFDQYFVFFNALVADKVEVLDYYIYKVGILTNDYSYSTVLGMNKTLISITLLFVANFLSKKVRGQSIV
jgi:ABC-type polysaccharide transport system permease subunit